MSKSLNKEFEEMFALLSKISEPVPQDMMLKLYAFYKQATFGDAILIEEEESTIKNAFKFNAWNQLKGMPKEKAKQEYINLAKEILTTNSNKK